MQLLIYNYSTWYLRVVRSVSDCETAWSGSAKLVFYVTEFASTKITWSVFPHLWIIESVLSLFCYLYLIWNCFLCKYFSSTNTFFRFSSLRPRDLIFFGPLWLFGHRENAYWTAGSYFSCMYGSCSEMKYLPVQPELFCLTEYTVFVLLVVMHYFCVAIIRGSDFYTLLRAWVLPRSIVVTKLKWLSI